MSIVCFIRYDIDPFQRAAFKTYAENWIGVIPRCGGHLIGYFLPTKFAGPTNVAYALIRFANLTAYEKYREALGKDPDAIANVAAADDCDASAMRGQGWAPSSQIGRAHV